MNQAPAPSSGAVQDRTAPSISRIALTIDEAAQALGVSRRTIEGQIAKGVIKPRLVGRYQLISVNQLERLFRS